MPAHSHSSLETFQQCKYKYKLRYIDKIRSPVETIEAFMGKKVHDALERLYLAVKEGNVPNKDEVLAFYIKRWQETWKDTIRIVKKERSAQDYRDMGAIIIANHYEKNTPFNKRTILALETQEFLPITEGHSYHVRIDSLAKDAEGNVYVIDFKTSSRLKAEEELQSDRQLAMYSLWVKAQYPEAKNIFLVWDFLVFNEEKQIKVTEDQLKQVREKVESIIKAIEETSVFPTNTSKLCDYCEYKAMCPAWNETGKERAPSTVWHRQAKLGDF